MIMSELFMLQGAPATSTVQLVLTSSGETKVVLIICALLSLTSWGIIAVKWWQFRALRRQAAKFFDGVERANRLVEAHQFATRQDPSPYQRVLREGVAFLNDVRPGALGGAPATGSMSATQLDVLKLVLSKEVATEREGLMRYIPLLATIGAIGPLLGLLGTVLGVMDAFLGIASKGGGNMSAVAPGIAEALIATAAGLLAAIPAVVFYNVFLNRVRSVVVELQGFAQELIGTMAREGLL
jgi:biopolymer transport protein TolQ